MADDGLRGRLAKSGEDALGKLAQDLLENPLVNSALTRAFEAREKATQAQEAALGALNIPSAADVERLTRRLRSVSQRLEGIEDGVDRLDQRLAELKGSGANPLSALEERLGAIEGQLSKLASDVSLLARASDAAPTQVPREQERLAVEKADDDKPAAKPRKPRTKKSAST
jgi:chromosome segregation ATPase